MSDEKLIATLELSPKYILGFSLKTFRGKKYASITRFLISDYNEPKPIGGLTLGLDKFKEMVEIMEQHIGDLLDPVEKEITYISLKQNETLRICVSVYNSKSGIDLRKYIIDGENKIPTRKGIRIPIEEADSLEDCLQQLSQAIK